MTIALLQLAATMMMVGANVVVGKLLAQALPVPLVLFLRCSIAVAVLGPLAWRAGGLRVSPRLLANLALQAATGTALYNLSLLAGLRHTGALQAGLVLSTLPATVAVAAFLLLGERLAPRRWLAAGLAVTGMAALAIGRTGGSGADGSLLGNALVFGAVLAEAAWILLSRLSAARVGLLTGAFWMQVFGLTMLSPFALPALPDHLATLSQPTLLGLLLFHAMTASVISVILWFSGMRRVPANLAGVFAVLLPATAAALAVLVLGERMTAPLAAGFALMLGSILLATWPSRRPGSRPP